MGATLKLRERHRATSRSSAARSATTSPRPSPGSPTARRSSTCRPVGGGPTGSSTTRSTASRLGLLGLGVEKGDRVGIWSPNCAEWVFVQYATAKIGAILVNINPAYRSHELQYVLNQSGRPLLVAAPSFKTSDYAAMIDEVRGECPALERVVLLGVTGLGRARVGGGVGADGARRPRPRRWASTTRSTSSTRRARRASRRARRSRTTTSSTTGYFVGRAARLHRGRPGVRAGALLPLLRDGDGQPRRRRRTASTHRHPGAGVRPGGDAAGRAGRALHVALRRADDVHRRAGAARLRRLTTCTSLRTGIMAGSPVPGRGDEAGRGRDAHGRGHDHVRHDRDVAGVDDDPPRGRPRAPRLDGRHRDAARRGADRRSRRPGCTVPTGDARRGCAPAATP